MDNLRMKQKTDNGGCKQEIFSTEDTNRYHPCKTFHDDEVKYYEKKKAANSRESYNIKMRDVEKSTEVKSSKTFHDKEVKYHEKKKGPNSRESDDIKMREPETSEEKGLWPTCIWLSNINPFTTAVQLKQKLSKYGAVLSVKIITNGSKYLGQVLMENRHHAQFCVDKLHLTQFDGYLIRVSFEQPFKAKNKSRENSRVKSPRKYDMHRYYTNSSGKKRKEGIEKERLHLKKQHEVRPKTKKKSAAEMYEYHFLWEKMKKSMKEQYKEEEKCYLKGCKYKIRREDKIKHRNKSSATTQKFENPLRSISTLNSDNLSQRVHNIRSEEHSFDEDNLYSIKDIKGPLQES